MLCGQVKKRKHKTGGCTRVTKSAHTQLQDGCFFVRVIYFIFSNDNGTDDMKAQGGRKGGWKHPTHGYCMVRAEGQARVPNGVKDIVSKISFFFHIYIYIGLIILFNYAKQGMPFFHLSWALAFPRLSQHYYSLKKTTKKNGWTRFFFLGGRGHLEASWSPVRCGVESQCSAFGRVQVGLVFSVGGQP